MSFARLLMVDDDAELCALLKARLEKTGNFSIDYVNDPTMAHNRAKYMGPENIDAFLLDIDMPGMSGGELAELLGEDPAFAHIPVIFLSSLVRPEEADHYGNRHRFPVLSKSNNLKELVLAIQETLKK